MNESVPMKHAQNFVLPPPAPIFNPTKNLTAFASFTPPQTNTFVLNNNIVKLVGTIPTVADPRTLPPTQIPAPPTEIVQNVPQPTHARGQLLNGCRIVLYGKDFENLQKDLMESVKDNGGISYAGISSLRTKSITHFITTEATYEHMQNSTKSWIRNMQVRVVNENWLVDTIESNTLQDVALYKLRNEDDFEVETTKPPQEKRAARPKIIPSKKKRSLPESESPPPERTKRQRKVAQRASSKRFDQSWVTDFDEEQEVSDEPVSEEEEPEVEIDENDHNATYTLLDILATCERLESIEPKKIAPPPPRKRDPPPGEVLKWTIEQTQDWLTEKVSTDEQDAEVLQQWAKRELIDGEALLELDTMEYLKYTDFALGTKLRIQNAVLGLKANKSM